jgi:hypothetical protein
MPPADDDAVLATDGVVHTDVPGGAGVVARRRWLYATTSTVLALIMALAVADAADVADVYGVDSASVGAEGGGYRLRVRYTTVSRPGLAGPFDIVVERADGFAEPLTIGVDQDYMRLWDENGLYPSPSTETTLDGWVVWEFDPPGGNTLSFAYDARIEPAAQDGRDGRVAVLEDGVPVVQVQFSTRVLP